MAEVFLCPFGLIGTNLQHLAKKWQFVRLLCSMKYIIVLINQCSQEVERMMLFCLLPVVQGTIL